MIEKSFLFEDLETDETFIVTAKNECEACDTALYLHYNHPLRLYWEIDPATGQKIH